MARYRVLAASLAAAAAEQLLTVASYNMYWWHVSQFNHWDLIFNKLRSEEPFDIIGFQETDDVVSVLDNIGLTDWEKAHDYHIAACPIAWNPKVFSVLEGPDHVAVSQDAWERQLVWVRLRHKGSGVVIFFANTHGPLGCEDHFGTAIIEAINARVKGGDKVVMTGDFNCNSHQKSMQDVMRFLPIGIHAAGKWAFPDGGVDHIMSRELPLAGGGPRDGYPSDHPFMKAQFKLSGSAPSPGWPACRPGSKACCNPNSSPRQVCPGGAPCERCGNAAACECPSGYQNASLLIV